MRKYNNISALKLAKLADADMNMILTSWIVNEGPWQIVTLVGWGELIKLIEHCVYELRPSIANKDKLGNLEMSGAYKNT